MILHRIIFLLKSNKLHVTIMLLISCMMPLPVSAAEMNLREVITNTGSENWLYIKGELVEGDSMKFINTISTINDVTTVWLESDGGLVDEGMAIAKMAKMLDLNTYVEKNCNSMCAIIFLSGKARQVTKKAVVGVHAAYNKNNGMRGVDANSIISWYLGSLGYPEELVHLWVGTSPKKIFNINSKTADQLGLGFTTIEPVKRPLIKKLLSVD